MMMTYTPNLTDKRVLKRMRHAYGFSRACLDAEPRAWSRTMLDKHFGQQQHDLSRFLRSIVLECTSPHYQFGAGVTECKSYISRAGGMAYLRGVLMGRISLDWRTWWVENKAKFLTTEPGAKGSLRESLGRTEGDGNQEETGENPPPSSYPIVSLLFDLTPEERKFDEEVVNHWCQREFGDDLKNLQFEYKDQSQRLWHPLQHVRTAERRKMQADAGLVHHYDIDACAPTLILQHAMHFGLGEDTGEVMYHIEQYLKRKDLIRTEIATAIHTPKKTVKVLINSFFCGARLGANPQFAIWHLLDGDYERIRALKDDPFITGLRTDIKTCWEIINQTVPRVKAPDKNGKVRLKPVTSKQKWNRYFQLERSVLDATRKYLKDTDNPCFLEHDGWVTKHPIDQVALKAAIYEATGFKVTLSYEKHEVTVCH